MYSKKGMYIDILVIDIPHMYMHVAYYCYTYTTKTYILLTLQRHKVNRWGIGSGDTLVLKFTPYAGKQFYIGLDRHT